MATRISVALEAETGTELCRVKLDGGSLGGYRSEILTENLSERENAMLKCLRCDGIMKDASISQKGEQICYCCKREDENLIPNENVRTTILSLKCGCPLSKRGCEWLGRLESVAEHLTTCGHVYESCQLSCGVVSTRDEMGRHLREECSQREEECLHCSGVHKVCEMVEHVKVCGKVSVLCELGCGTRVCRESILFHRESECSEATVVCPYGKYRCEVVALKRRELKPHLDENWRLHTELKLNALEENFKIYQRKNEILENNFDKLRKENVYLKEQINVLKSEMKSKDIEIELLTEEIEILKDPSIRTVSKVKWIIKDILNKFKPNLGFSFSDFYEVAGYQFKLRRCTDAQNFMIDFHPKSGSNYGSLEWPFKAIFITRVICHRDTRNSLILKTPIIVLNEYEFVGYGSYYGKRIASVPLSTDWKDFIKEDSLELETSVRILKNI